MRVLLLLSVLLLPVLGEELAPPPAQPTVQAPAAAQPAPQTPTNERRVVLQSPLTTLVRLDEAITAAPQSLRAQVEVPTDAPADLGVGVFVVDQHGRWFQGLRPGVLTPGKHALELPIAGTGSLLAMSDRSHWSPAAAATIQRAGLFFWSASSSRATLIVHDATLVPLTPTNDQHRLTDLRVDPQASTGQRWSVSLRPQPFPANPFDSSEFSLDAVITLPDGKEQRIPGFLDQAMAHHDRGDRENVVPVGADAFTVRFRPRQPGTHQIRLEARWNGAEGTLVTLPLPPLNVGGTAWDEFVRVDAGDPRFFAVDGKFFWPRGPNLRSVYDTRGSDRMRTVLTPDRGTLAYDAYLRRLAPQGVNAVEVWLSSWNLALEWRAD